MTILVLDENVGSDRLVKALGDRGCAARTLKDLGANGKPDPDVVMETAKKIKKPWVLVTMDLSIIDDHSKFDWDRYALAWLFIRPDLSGIAVERSKTDTVHRWCHELRDMTPGNHWSLSIKARQRHAPSLAKFTGRHF